MAAESLEHYADAFVSVGERRKRSYVLTCIREGSLVFELHSESAFLDVLSFASSAEVVQTNLEYYVRHSLKDLLPVARLCTAFF